jgi:hypothetical protein
MRCDCGSDGRIVAEELEEVRRRELQPRKQPHFTHARPEEERSPKITQPRAHFTIRSARYPSHTTLYSVAHPAGHAVHARRFDSVFNRSPAKLARGRHRVLRKASPPAAGPTNMA